MSSAHPAFVSPAELAAVVERLEARALRAERALLRLDERAEGLDVVVTDLRQYTLGLDTRVDELGELLAAADHLAGARVAEAERLHRALERRVIDLERRARGVLAE